MSLKLGFLIPNPFQYYHHFEMAICLWTRHFHVSLLDEKLILNCMRMHEDKSLCTRSSQECILLCSSNSPRRKIWSLITLNDRPKIYWWNFLTASITLDPFFQFENNFSLDLPELVMKMQQTFPIHRPWYVTLQPKTHTEIFFSIIATYIH